MKILAPATGAGCAPWVPQPPTNSFCPRQTGTSGAPSPFQSMGRCGRAFEWWHTHSSWRVAHGRSLSRCRSCFPQPVWLPSHAIMPTKRPRWQLPAFLSRNKQRGLAPLPSCATWQTACHPAGSGCRLASCTGTGGGKKQHGSNPESAPNVHSCFALQSSGTRLGKCPQRAPHRHVPAPAPREPTSTNPQQQPTPP